MSQVYPEVTISKEVSTLALKSKSNPGFSATDWPDCSHLTNQVDLENQ